MMKIIKNYYKTLTIHSGLSNVWGLQMRIRVSNFLWLWLEIQSLAVDLARRSITVHICIVS